MTLFWSRAQLFLLLCFLGYQTTAFLTIKSINIYVLGWNNFSFSLGTFLQIVLLLPRRLILFLTIPFCNQINSFLLLRYTSFNIFIDHWCSLLWMLWYETIFFDIHLLVISATSRGCSWFLALGWANAASLSKVYRFTFLILIFYMLSKCLLL